MDDKIQSLAITALKPYEKNNKKHSPELAKRLAESIKEFGWTYPVLIDEDNIILAGHKRLLAAKALGLKEVPILRKTGLTEAQKRAYRILDNKITHDSPWDLDAVQFELDALTAAGFDLPKFGLDDFPGLNLDLPQEVTEDEFEADPLDELSTCIKLGDVIELGRHRVMCGDSREAITSELFQSADVIVTDPPYGIGENYASFDDTEENLFELIDKVLIPIIEKAPRVALTSGVKQMFHYPRPTWVMAWVNEAGTGMSPWGFCCWQPVLVYGKDPYLATGKGSRPDLFKGNIPAEKNGHPCPKPLPVWAEVIKRVSLDKERIFDPFLGSGTTLIAAEQLGRTCYGMEIEPKYCQVIVDRYEAHCRKAGKPFECRINGEAYTPAQKDG